MVSIIAWTRTALKSGFKFWTKPLLDVRASDASDLPMVGISATAVVRPISVQGHHEDKATAFRRIPATAGLDLGVIIR
jgi:hypothetical protein